MSFLCNNSVTYCLDHNGCTTTPLIHESWLLVKYSSPFFFIFKCFLTSRCSNYSSTILLICVVTELLLSDKLFILQELLNIIFRQAQVLQPLHIRSDEPRNSLMIHLHGQLRDVTSYTRYHL
jgi:hypothetical protein